MYMSSCCSISFIFQQGFPRHFTVRSSFSLRVDVGPVWDGDVIDVGSTVWCWPSRTSDFAVSEAPCLLPEKIAIYYTTTSEREKGARRFLHFGCPERVAAESRGCDYIVRLVVLGQVYPTPFSWLLYANERRPHCIGNTAVLRRSLNYCSMDYPFPAQSLGQTEFPWDTCYSWPSTWR